jgi:YVTN family beta-propeller protein
MRTLPKLLAGAVVLAACAEGPVVAADALLTRMATIELPGPPGQRFDYLLVDRDDGWLFSAHLGASQTYVLDLASNSVIATIKDTPGVEGLAYVPTERKLYTSNALDNTVGVVDLKTFKVVRKIPTEAKPDGIAYAAPQGKIYVSDERARALAVIDVKTDTQVSVIRFDSETGVPEYDAGTGLVYVNLQDKNVLAAVDPITDKVAGRYPLDGCQGNHGMALDVANHLAFIACQGNNRLVVFDLRGHNVLVSFAIPAGSDVVAFDAGLKRAYVGCAVGSIAVFQEDDPTHVRALGEVKAERNVHSLAVDPVTHRVYAPEQEENRTAVARMVVYEAANAP